MRVLVVAAALLLLPQRIPELPKDRDAALAQGEIVVATAVPEGSSAVFIVAEGVIDAPPARVFAIVDACNDHAQTMANVKASKELSRTGDVVLCSTTVDMPFPLSDLDSTTRAVNSVEKLRYIRAWTLVEGDYDQYEGRWVIEPFEANPERSRARLEVAMELKLPIPRAIVELGQARIIPQVFVRLRDSVRAQKAAPH